MYIKLDPEIINILCCPLCKGVLKLQKNEFVCKDCASRYPSINVPQGKFKDSVFDFRIHRPNYCMSEGMARWSKVQKDYEDGYFERYTVKDDLTTYLIEVDSIKKIYGEEFDIKGRVLDIGGGEGKLRQYIKKDKVSLYISVDPLINGSQNLELRPNLLKAYPCLSKPCNFLSCYAENIPFIKNTFDVVHIKSALDHFSDPYFAIKEAYRVLKEDGTLIISSTVYGGKSFSKSENRDIFLRRWFSAAVYKFRMYGLKDFLETAFKKALRKKGWATSHVFDWKYEDLISLLSDTNFKIKKEYWQLPPFDMIVWLQAKKLNTKR